MPNDQMQVKDEKFMEHGWSIHLVTLGDEETYGRLSLNLVSVVEHQNTYDIYILSKTLLIPYGGEVLPNSLKGSRALPFILVGQLDGG